MKPAVRQDRKERLELIDFHVTSLHPTNPLRPDA
jgi:hypothetical protein